MRHILIIILLSLAYLLNAQLSNQATLTTKASKFNTVESLSDQISNGTFIPAPNIRKEYNPKKSGVNSVVPGKGLPKNGDPLWKKQLQKAKIANKEPLLTFQAASAYATPTDPTGAVGPSHFVNAWNSSFRIWDKQGNALTASASLANIFPGNDMGDPIVIYDQFADRFLVTQFYANGFLVAITQGPDPVNDGWYTYEFATNTFPDYPKYSIWSDGYYITANKDANTADYSEVVFVIERDEIIAGNSNAQMVGFPLPSITTSGFYSPLALNVTGSQLPSIGNAPVVYMQDDSWSGVDQDHLKIWSINVDWANPSSSTIDDPQELNTSDFDGLFDGGSFSNLPQPSGSDIDALQATVMYMAQFRKFSDHNSAVLNFVVDLDGGDDLAGIRWYEIRQDDDGAPWQIYQEGTYAQPDGHSAFSGNMCMDAQGNIALAYTAVSDEMYPSLRYTGRFASDELNTMTLEEGVIGDGSQSNPSYRYGDYSQMTVDPVDDLTFWSIGEYFTGGARKNLVGVFKLASDYDNDVGVVSIDEPSGLVLSDNEIVSVTVRNFGAQNQGDFSIAYQVDNNEVVEEVFDSEILSLEDVTFAFETTADFSQVGQEYNLKVYTSLTTDENVTNDTIQIEITPQYANDIGVVSLLSPQSGAGLTSEEVVSLSIENYGAEPQVNFDVIYKLNDDNEVVESVNSTVEPGETITYSFNQAANLEAVMDHTIFSSTILDADEDLENDAFTFTVTNDICQPLSNCANGDGLEILTIGDFVNESGCAGDGYQDFTDMTVRLETDTDNDFVFATENQDVYVKIWVDWNDNFIFEFEEAIVNSYGLEGSFENGLYIDALDVDIDYDAPLGEHLMRVRTRGGAALPYGACDEVAFGETEDYKIEAWNRVTVNNLEAWNNDLEILSLSNNKFVATFASSQVTKPLTFAVHNTSGQTVIYDRVYNQNGEYQVDFDMSLAPSGLYLIRIGNDNYGKIAKIVVQ